MRFLQNLWDGFCLNGFTSLCIASHLHYNNVLCILDVCLLCFNDCVLVGLDWAKPMMFLSLHVTCLCIFHAYVPSFIFMLIFICVGAFLLVSLSPSLFLSVSCFMAPKRKSIPSQNPLPSKVILLLLTYGSVMIKPGRTLRRTFLDKAFIRNAKSFYRIFLLLTYPLSSTVGVGSHCVAPRSPVPP